MLNHLKYGGVIIKADLTVVIPLYNAEKCIYSCVRSLLAQAVKNFEIIIIEDPCSMFYEN